MSRMIGGKARVDVTRSLDEACWFFLAPSHLGTFPGQLFCNLLPHPFVVKGSLGKKLTVVNGGDIFEGWVVRNHRV